MAAALLLSSPGTWAGTGVVKIGGDEGGLSGECSEELAYTRDGRRIRTGEMPEKICLYRTRAKLPARSSEGGLLGYGKWDYKRSWLVGEFAFSALLA